VNFAVHVLGLVGIYGVLALGYTLVYRNAGLLSLAYGCYFAIGAYAYALGSLKGQSLPEILIVAFLLSGTLSLVESLLAWRLRSDQFFVGSIALQAFTYSTVLNWVSVGVAPGTLRNLTNGAFGLAGLPKSGLFGIQLDTDGRILALILASVLISLTLFRRLIQSPWGRSIEVLRDDEVVAGSLGKSGRRLRTQVLMIGSLLSSLGGALYAAHTGFVDPEVASLSVTFAVLTMVAASDVFKLRTPLLAVAVLVSAPEALRFLKISSSMAADIQILAYGLLLIVVPNVQTPGTADSDPK